MKGILNLLYWIVFWIAVIGASSGIGIIPFGIVAYFTFVGAGRREEKARTTLSSTLMAGEKLIASGLQHRVFAFCSRRILVAITNSRILTMKRGLLGGFKMQDIQWKDLEDATIEQNVLSSLCGSNLGFSHFNDNVDTLAIEGIANDVASEIYAKAQFEEQAWEEKRRIREMEEARALSGGVLVQHGAGALVGSTGNQMYDDIEKAKRLLDMGAISDSEFQEMKSKILNSI
jgi:hypothetical protein